MKGYMASGQFSRGKENIRADGSIVMLGNFDVDVEQQQRVGHLLSPLPPEMRDDTAFMDRLHGYAPGWDFPKLNPNEHLTNHFRVSQRVLDKAALRHAFWGDTGAYLSRRSPQRSRHRSGQQNR
jgi:predicted ATP-dependent Lon-type protease